MDLLQNIIVISPEERDSLTCLEELDSEGDADAEEMAEERVLPFMQEVDHNMNAPTCKPFMSSGSVRASVPLTHEDIILPRCRTPTSDDFPQLDSNETVPKHVLNPITPTKSLSPEDSNESPWSPTANLKMLISAASPEIRNREQQKNRYSLKEDGQKLGANGKIKAGRRNKTKQHKGDSSCDYLATEGDMQMETDSQNSHSSRKEKSLGLLCHRFLSRFLEYPDPEEITEICLDEVAKELSVERRRIYDIINVLESVEIVSRLAKNRYLWHGKTNLKYTLAKLKALAKLEGFAQQVEMIKEFEVSNEFEGLVGEQDSNNEKANKIACECDKKAKSCKTTCKNFLRDNQKKDKSLGIMSQRFIMLFLLSKPKTVNLDLSAKILIGDPNIDKTENAKFKTKIRRLYDIANILTSLGLIKKVHVTECRGRKPAFKYTGPDTDDIDSFSTCSHDAAHRPSSRHSLLDCIQNPHVSSMLTVPKSFTSTSSSDHSPVSEESSDYKSVSVPPQLAKKSFSRHSSFEQICEVAELERNRLYYESSRSQPTSPTRDFNSQAKSIVKAPAAKCLLVPKSATKNDAGQKKDAKQQTKSTKMVILRAVDSESRTFTLSENQLRGLLKNVGTSVVSTVGINTPSAACSFDVTKPMSTDLSSDNQQKLASTSGSLVVTSGQNQTVPPKQVTLIARDGQLITKRLLDDHHHGGEPPRKQIKIANGRHVSRKIILPVKLANGMQRKVVISHAGNNTNEITNGFKEDSENNQNATPQSEQQDSITVSSADKNDFCRVVQTIDLHQCTTESPSSSDVQPMKSEVDVKQARAMFVQSLSPPVYHVSGLNSPVMLLPKQQTSPMDTQESTKIQSPDHLIQAKPVVPSSHVVLPKSVGQQFVSGLGQFVSPVTGGTPRTSGSIVVSSSEFSPLSTRAPLLTQSSHQVLLSNGISSPLPSFRGQSVYNEAVTRSKVGMPLSSSNIINLVPLFSSTSDNEQASHGPQQITTPVREPITPAFVINPHQELSQSQLIQLPVRRPDAVYLTPNAGIKQILVNGKPISTPGCFFHSTPGGLQQVTSSSITCGQNSAFQAIGQFPVNNCDTALSAARKLYLSSEGGDHHL